jgi:hypothetical protein
VKIKSVKISWLNLGKKSWISTAADRGRLTFLDLRFLDATLQTPYASGEWEGPRNNKPLGSGEPG